MAKLKNFTLEGGALMVTAHYNSNLHKVVYDVDFTMSATRLDFAGMTRLANKLREDVYDSDLFYCTEDGGLHSSYMSRIEEDWKGEGQDDDQPEGGDESW